jgi:hypothetical protein
MSPSGSQKTRSFIPPTSPASSSDDEMDPDSPSSKIQHVYDTVRTCWGDIAGEFPVTLDYNNYWAWRDQIVADAELLDAALLLDSPNQPSDLSMAGQKIWEAKDSLL